MTERHFLVFSLGFTGVFIKIPQFVNDYHQVILLLPLTDRRDTNTCPSIRFRVVRLLALADVFRWCVAHFYIDLVLLEWVRIGTVIGA